VKYVDDLYKLNIINKETDLDATSVASLETALNWFLSAKNPAATTATHIWDEGGDIQDGPSDENYDLQIFTCTVCGDTKYEQVDRKAKTISLVEEEDGDVVMQWSGYNVPGKRFFFKIIDSDGKVVIEDQNIRPMI
jgi:hypothetical protein